MMEKRGLAHVDSFKNSYTLFMDGADSSRRSGIKPRAEASRRQRPRLIRTTNKISSNPQKASLIYAILSYLRVPSGGAWRYKHYGMGTGDQVKTSSPILVVPGLQNFHTPIQNHSAWNPGLNSAISPQTQSVVCSDPSSCIFHDRSRDISRCSGDRWVHSGN